MPTLTELIKEFLKDKLTNQIRATLVSEDDTENSDDNKSGKGKPKRYGIFGTLK